MKAQNIARAVLCAVAIFAAPAFARVTSIDVSMVEPFAEGASFGETGAYERVKGTFKGELDPADPRNRVIVNLDKAPRNAAGKVEYEADFFILRPADSARGNRKILYDVTNRGRKGIHNRLMDARAPSLASGNDPKTAQDIGNGLLLRMGYTLVWSGWDPGAPRTNNGMAMARVIATNGHAPIVRLIRDEIVPGTRVRAPPAKGGVQRETLRLSYEAANLDQAQAKLTVRRGETDPRREIPPSGWTYAGPRQIALLPDSARPEAGAIYEFHYPAKNPAVLGIGFAATRDLISFLRREKATAAGQDNPAGVTCAISSTWASTRMNRPAKRTATRACLSKSATATTPATWNASWQPLIGSLPIACCCARTPGRSSRGRRARKRRSCSRGDTHSHR